MNQDSVKEEQRKAAYDLVRKAGYDMFTDVGEGSKTDREMYCLINDIASLLASREQQAAERAARAVLEAVETQCEKVLQDSPYSIREAARAAASPFLSKDSS